VEGDFLPTKFFHSGTIDEPQTFAIIELQPHSIKRCGDVKGLARCSTRNPRHTTAEGAKSSPSRGKDVQLRTTTAVLAVVLFFTKRYEKRRGVW
jgi:hypothetical protein